MATNIKIIQPGYATLLDCGDPSAEHRKVGKFMKASGSCCLVESGGSRLLFDCMGPWERSTLLDELAAHKVHPDDIDKLVCSHSHADHIGNLNLFTNAKKHVVGRSVYHKDVYDLSCFQELGKHTYKSPKSDTPTSVVDYESLKLDSHLTVEPSEGHTEECVTLIVSNCDSYGTVALTGDLFENEDDLLNDDIWLSSCAHDSEVQRASRTRIYNKVDYILPGHGKIFKTTGKKYF